jgi:uracil-DNA glycosylase
MRSTAPPTAPGARDLAALLAAIRACRLCEAHLPLGPKPTLVAAASARILIAGQAPGTKVHMTGIPWNDASGDRLRQWLDLDRSTFYDPRRIAIVPMGFCYPGKTASGDKAPRPECAATWHGPLLAELAKVELIVAAGSYAHAYHLGPRRRATLTETVRAWRRYRPRVVPIPHPSWHNNRWLEDNPWFAAETIPYLRARVARLLRAE